MIINNKAYGKDVFQVGESVAKFIQEGKKLEALKQLKRIGIEVHFDPTNNENYGAISLRSAKEFIEGISSVMNANAAKVEAIDVSKIELELYKAFREKNYSVAESIAALQIAIEVFTKQK